jgi:hypothetical protein
MTEAPAEGVAGAAERARCLGVASAGVDLGASMLVIDCAPLVPCTLGSAGPSTRKEEAPAEEADDMAKIGKQIENRLTVSGKVAASAQTHRAEVAKSLAAQAKAVQGSKTQATADVFETTIGALQDMVERAAAALKKAELTYAAEQADDVQPRSQRDALAIELNALMARLRSTVEDALGSEALRTYGLEGSTPRSARPLVHHVANVVSLMQKKPATVTTEFGSTFSTEATVTAIQAKGAALEVALKVVDREARELEKAQSDRDQAVELWTEVYQGVATALSGLYRLAGRKDLADRVRPTSRTITGEDAPPESTAGGADGGEAGSETSDDE